MKTSGLAGGSGLRTSEQEVEKLQKEAKELRGQLEEVQRRVEKLEGEKRALEDQVEQNDYERAIIESKQTDQERESRSRIQSLTDQACFRCVSKIRVYVCRYVELYMYVCVSV